MPGRSSRLKGSNGEREAFKICNDIAGEELFKRHQNPFYGRGKHDNSDPESKLPVAIEVKRCETLALPKWIAQAKAQAAPHQTPILAFRRNKEPWTWLAVMDDNEWQRYLRWKLQESKSDSRQQTS